MVITIPDGERGVTNGMMKHFHERGLNYMPLEENLRLLYEECNTYHDWVGRMVELRTEDHIIYGSVTGIRFCGSEGPELLLDIGMLDAPYILTDVPASEVTVVAVPCPDCIA
jgi:hypothetical protein